MDTFAPSPPNSSPRPATLTDDITALATTSGRAKISKRKRYRLMSPFAAWPAIGFLVIFFVFPLINNFFQAFGGQASTHGVWFYYIKLFTDPYYLNILVETLKLSVIVTVVCLLLGYPVSYFMVRHAGRINDLIVFCLLAPLLTSVIIRTFGWQVLLARDGPINSILVGLGIFSHRIDLVRNPISVYIALVHVMIPFMILSITAVLSGIDQGYEEAARVLGANKWRAFFHVTLPLSLDGIASGCVLVFVITNGSFLAMLLLGGGKVNTLPLLIYQQFNLTHDMVFASAMGNVLLAAALICLLVLLRFIQRKGGRT